MRATVPLGQVAVAAASPVATMAGKSPPQGAAFDVVLMLHVGCFLVSFVSVLVTGTQAWRARTGPNALGAASIARYFRPGINWPGRTIYGVIVFGIVLIAMSDRVYSFGDAFVQIGLVLWIVATFLSEYVVWPGERSLQMTISAHWSDGDGRAGQEARTGREGRERAGLEAQVGLEAQAGPQESSDMDSATATGVPASGQDSAVPVAAARKLATRVALSAWTVCAVMIVATVIMVDKP